MTHDTTTAIPTILFGAFDRHNFGDLLFPHIAAALLDGSSLLFAGLAARDLRCHGGHLVSALAQLAGQWGERPVNIIHAGGELLSCDAWQAAVMLLPSEQAQQAMASHDANPRKALEWAHAQLGIAALAPYTIRRELFPRAASVIYDAVGGVELNQSAPALRAEVLANLKAADLVTVRDRQTQALLNAAGIATRLIPDSAVMAAELFGTTIHRHAQQGAVARMRDAFPQGYIAVQFSADFGGDETLARIAAQLDQVVDASGYGIVFFRAGAAPWHDDLQCYQRVKARMRSPSSRVFTSLHLWDICALLACSRAYLGSSLHGRIVALAFALPHVNMRHPAQTQQLSKQDAFAATWEEPGMAAVVEVEEIAQGMREAMNLDRGRLQRIAGKLAAQYRQGFDAIRSVKDAKSLSDLLTSK